MSKKFARPPKKGPQPQGMQEGGLTEGERFVEFFGEQFNKNKDKVVDEAVTGLFKRDLDTRFQNLMNQAQKDFYQQEGINPNPYKMDFVAINPQKEATGISTEETTGLKLKGGGFGCPHRERGVKSDIKGIKPIQLFGKSFKGVK